MYILLGYLGITVQLALTIDIIYLFTIPTILIYRALASLYKYLLIVIGFFFEVLSRDFERWVSCPFPQIKKAPNCAKTFSLALLIIFVKVLLFVAFYYVWLAVIMIGLTLFLVKFHLWKNFLQNILTFFRELGLIVYIVKNYEQNLTGYQKINLIRKSVKKNCISLISLETIRDILSGNNLIVFPSSSKNPSNNFIPVEMYKILINISDWFLQKIYINCISQVFLPIYAVLKKYDYPFYARTFSLIFL